MNKIENFQETRTILNQLVLKYSNREIKRFFSIDSMTYEDGALSKKMKELLGLVASLVLRCDDCVMYHLIQCFEIGFTSDEIIEALGVGLVVGGSITIPHLRRAIEAWDELTKLKPSKEG